MTITGEDQEVRGQVLLLAAAPQRSRRRLLDPEPGAIAMANVPVRSLLPHWRGPADLVQLLDPAEPQAVLARLRSAAAVRGPLLLYICGQLTRDHRQHLVHLALARTTETTIRCTALPWAWIARELADRRPATTTVILDLVADPSCLPMCDADLALPAHVARWGAVAPPIKRGPRQAPAYTRALSELLRNTPDRQHLAHLHPLAAGQARLERGTVLLTPAEPVAVELPRPRPAAAAPTAPPAPSGEPVDDPRPAIARALRAGHHHTAAELAAHWEHAVLRSQGRATPSMGDVLEVQATVATAAGGGARAADRWLATCEHRLQWTSPRQETVRLAARNALACWQALEDGEPHLGELGRRLAIVLRTVGAQHPAGAVEARLAELQETVVYSPPPGWNR
ncbi:hypothetical protein [Kitasatospora sp. NBC_01302]|uniref:hypothetical protein n=1 Tax=Kitasatospora sp. NBC_01302 TaxID=2903575 RepID=UPI002E159E85|nr:hypothetical protein OG294_00120 [Kitasatospora sp. NBC_01302]